MKNNDIPCIYINGLGNNQMFPYLISFFWRNYNFKFFFSDINWFDKENYEIKKNKILLLAKSLIKKHGKLVIIGVSAGASLALSVFDDIKNENVSIVIVNGRLFVGDYETNDKNSLFHSARLDKSRSTQAFFDAVNYVDKKVIPKLSENDLSKIFILKSLVDGRVPGKVSAIDNTKQFRSITIGHNVGIFFHVLLCKNKIQKFTYTTLNKQG